MSQRKNRNKKHNPRKRHAAYARALLKKLNAVVVWVAGQNDGAVRLVNLRHGHEIPVVKELVGAIADVPHDWSVLCVALGRRQDGQEYIQTVPVSAPRCFQDQIADELNNVHMDLIRQMNPNHRAGIAWIACPWGADISDSVAAGLLENLGAWCLEPEQIEVAA